MKLLIFSGIAAMQIACSNSVFGQTETLTVSLDQITESMIRRNTKTIERVRRVVGKEIDAVLALRIGFCSESAAHPDDPGNFDAGVKFSAIVSKFAIESCVSAYVSGGHQFGLVVTSLSRAYNKAEDYSNSLRYAKEAVALGYPFGDVMMGIHYQYGDGIKKSAARSFDWYKKAAKKGVSSAMRATSENLTNGTGTNPDLDQAMYWAIQAINKNDAKAFYQLGKVLEKSSKGKTNARPTIVTAIEAYEIAAENSVDAKNEITRLREQLRPNRIAGASILSHSKVKGRFVDGVFLPVEADFNWYLGNDILKNGNRRYAYARTSDGGSTFTLWYAHDSSGRDSGWYISFSYAGNNTVEEFYGVRVVPKGETGTKLIDLDASGLKVQNFAGADQLTARITFRDVYLLMKGEAVKVRFKKKHRSNKTSFTLVLNDSNNDPAASTVLPRLITTAKKLDSACCQEPGIIPLSKTYFDLLEACNADHTSHRKKRGRYISQNCDILLKNTNFTHELYTKPLYVNIARLLKDAIAVTSGR